ncbi:MAG TPA: ATP-binding protein [Bacteroidota bacterium]
MEDLSLHILDIAENSIAAGARNLTILICEDAADDLLCLEITDDGKGMSADIVRQAAHPFYTTRTTRSVGLGLALLEEAATAANGALTIVSEPKRGTTIKATFQLSHIDRKPLGNMAETVTALIATHRGMNILYKHMRNGTTVLLDTKEIQRQTGSAPLDSVEALRVIREYLNREEQTLAR